MEGGLNHLQRYSEIDVALTQFPMAEQQQLLKHCGWVCLWSHWRVRHGWTTGGQPASARESGDWVARDSDSYVAIANTLANASRAAERLSYGAH